MPKIPDPASLQRAIPQADTSVVRMDTRAAGKGLEILGQLAGDFAERASRHELSKAESDFIIKKMEIDTEAKHDNDYKTLPDRYTSGLNEELGKIASNISDPMKREEFVNRGKSIIAQGQSHVADIAWNKEKDHERSQLDERLTAMKDNVLKSDGDIVTANHTAMDLIQSSADMGYLSEQEKTKLSEGFRNNLAVDRLGMMEPEQRIEALKLPWAKNLPAEVHTKLLKEAEDASLAGKARRTVDDLMNQNVDRAAGMADIRKIKDPKELAETERRFDYVFGRKKQAIIEQQSELFDKYFLPIREGKQTVDDIPRSDLEKMSPAQQNNLFAAQSQSVKGGPKYSDRGVIDKLNVLYQTKQFDQLRQYFTDNASKLNESDYHNWSQVSVKGVVPVEVKSIFTAQQYMTRQLKAAGIKSDDDVGEFSNKLNDWFEQYQMQNNKVPTDAEVTKQIDTMLLEFDTSWYWGGTKPIFQMDQEERNKSLELVRKDDPDTFNDASQYFTKKNIDPSYEQFMSVYQQLKDLRNGTK